MNLTAAQLDELEEALSRVARWLGPHEDPYLTVAFVDEDNRVDIDVLRALLELGRAQQNALEALNQAVTYGVDDKKRPELADFDPTDGHRHTCHRNSECDCAAWLYVIAQDARIERTALTSPSRRRR